MENNKQSFYEMLDKQTEVFEKQLEEARNRGEEVPESIWAPGIPEKINQDDLIKPEELMSMAVNYIMKNEMIRWGFKVEQGFPRPSYPNIIAKRNGKTYAIIIVPNVFPKFQVINAESKLGVVKQCKENNLIPLFAPVGYRSMDRERAAKSIMLKGDLYITVFRGFIILNDDPEQLKAIKPEYILNLKKEDEEYAKTVMEKKQEETN